MKKQIKRRKSFIERLFDKKLIKNKIMAILMIVLGALTIPIEGDCTGFVVVSMLALPVFFAKENVVDF